ncbi:MAG: DivIVA domain-containing protein, partial [Synergistales bacterium]|nr:DivIVA domain-containing protein [Synergistales bacterium]
MTELLTAMDVANQQFRRSLRGYDPRDVDEFLDRVSETIHAYAEQYREEKRRAERLEEQISEYTELKDSLQDALVMAQQSAEERVKSAEHQASTIVEEAQSRAERLVT